MKAIILLDFPTEIELQLKKFIPSEHRVLFKILHANGIDPNSLTATYCFKEEIVPKSEDIKNSKKAFNDLIDKIKPDYILACGDLPLRVATKHRGITKYRGSLIGNVFPVFNYRGLEYSMHNKNIFNSDMQVFCGLIKNAKADYSKLHTHYIDCVSKIDNSVRSIFENSIVTYDIETTGLDETKDEITMLGMCVKFHDKYLSYVFMGEDSIRQGIHILMSARRKIAHNAKFDNKFLNLHAPSPIYADYDTMLGGYIIDETTPHSLKYLSRACCGADMYEEGIDFTSTPLKTIATYCAKDCYWTYRLMEWQVANLKDKSKVLANIVLPGAKLLEDIHRRGVYIDKEVLKDSLEKSEKLIEDLKLELDSLLPAGLTEVNYNSPAQLKTLLYDKFKYKPFKDGFTKKPDYSTGKAILKKYARDGSTFCTTLLKYRTYTKMRSGFLEPYEELTRSTDRIHPQYNIARTSTGRLSSSDPNLQQISRDPMVRHLISAPKGKVFIECDYSQIELRVASWIGNIKSMKNLYKQDADIHTNTAKMIARLKGASWDSLDKDEQKQWRTKAKAVNFGFIYGMSAQGFLEYADTGYDLLLTLAEANEYRQAYFTLYPELIEWHTSAKRKAKIDKLVVSPLGRVRHLPNIDSRDSYEKGKAERCALNSPVQSTASDLTILSMVRLNDILDDTCKIVGQCHDAIFFECDDDYIDKNCKIIKDTMENLPLKKLFGVEIDVPLIAEPTVGKSWGQGYDWVEK